MAVLEHFQQLESLIPSPESLLDKRQLFEELRI